MFTHLHHTMAVKSMFILARVWFHLNSLPFETPTVKGNVAHHFAESPSSRSVGLLTADKNPIVKATHVILHSWILLINIVISIRVELELICSIRNELQENETG